jgi:hypothetical protein
MRKLLRSCGIGFMIAGCDAGGGQDPLPPPSEKHLSAATGASGNGQSAEITTTLPLPLRVVFDQGGTRVAGVTVIWNTPDGLLDPQGATDAEGIATAVWTLNTAAGAKTATATVQGLRDTVTFIAIAVAPGPAVSIRKVIASGDNQTVAANAASFSLPLTVHTVDQYVNPVPGPITWTIESGPVAWATQPPSRESDAGGRSDAYVRPVGTAGTARVRVSLDGAAPAGSAPAVEFTLTVGPPQYVVRLTSSSFISEQNRSRNPAVDTIPAGETVAWKLDFDYDPHRVVSVGSPSFATPGDFPYALNPEVAVTFPAPGAYRYTDFFNPAATGIIVVQ